MRKHDVRKWLHAVLDLLPVILIPVFMIYSHRHTIDSGSIEVPQNVVVDFNQQIGVLDSDDNGVLTYTSELYTYTYDYENSGEFYCRSVFSHNSINWLSGNKYFIRVVSSDEFTFRTSSSSLWFPINVNGSSTQFIYDCQFDEISPLFFGKYSAVIGDTFSFKYLQLFNLSQMFGVGNEPTIQQFNEWYDEPSYDYTLSHKELLKGVSNIIYDDSDIMSQATYQLYNAVDKYFNMGNVFNMTIVYDWFNLNIFNGNAPISIYIVWNIVLYEFVMDLLFLLYGLFMWFIDMIQKLMEKPLNSIK